MAMKGFLALFGLLLNAALGEVLTSSYASSPTSTATASFANRSVCYPVVGCFNNSSPYDNAASELPESPAAVGTSFYLHTDQAHSYNLTYIGPTGINVTGFDPTLPTKVIIHGYKRSAFSAWVVKMQQALLQKLKLNLVVVDWEKGARQLDYNQAAANTRLVAVQTRLLLDHLTNEAGLRLHDVHLIGHSLGAHIAGYIGHAFGRRIGRISGLDPAEPDYEGEPPLVRLDKTDAQFVDVIHTNGGFFGMTSPCGHVDFYVNGGKQQPGCPGLISAALGSFFKDKDVNHRLGCSHARATDLYTESINTSCPFTAYPCKDYASFDNGECLTCGQQGCASLGLHADQYRVRGSRYLNTRIQAPFCGYHYKVELHIPASTQNTKGRLKIDLIGQTVASGFLNITGDDNLDAGTNITHVVVSPQEVGHIKSVKITYLKHSGFWFTSGEDSLAVTNVKVTSGESGATFIVCVRRTLQHNTPLTLNTSTKCPTS